MSQKDVNYEQLGANVSSVILPLLQDILSENETAMGIDEMINKTSSLIALAASLSGEMQGVLWVCVAIIILIVGIAFLASVCFRRTKHQLLKTAEKTCNSCIASQESPTPSKIQKNFE